MKFYTYKINFYMEKYKQTKKMINGEFICNLHVTKVFYP